MRLVLPTWGGLSCCRCLPGKGRASVQPRIRVGFLSSEWVSYNVKFKTPFVSGALPFLPFYDHVMTQQEGPCQMLSPRQWTSSPATRKLSAIVFTGVTCVHLSLWYFLMATQNPRRHTAWHHTLCGSTQYLSSCVTWPVEVPPSMPCERTD